MMSVKPQRESLEEARVLSKTAINAAALLEINGATLGAVLGLSEATISRMKRLDYVLEPGSKAFELAILFVRVFRSLDAITGGDGAVAKAWLRNHNVVFHANPIDKIQKVSGLTDVLHYLDARRAII